MPAVTIRLTGELRPGRGDGRRGAGSGFGRQRPSTPTVVSGWERLAAVRLRSAATAAPAVADAPSAPGRAVAATRSSGVALGRNRLDAVTAGLLLHGLDVPGVAAATAGDGIAAPPPARTRRASSRSRSASRRTPETARRHPVRRRRSATAERRRLPRLRRPPAPRPPALGHLSPPPTPPSTSPSNRS